MDVSFNVENISVIEMNPSSSFLQPASCVAAKLLVSKQKHLRKQCYSSCLETASSVVASTCALRWLLPLSIPAAASTWLPLPGWWQSLVVVGHLNVQPRETLLCKCCHLLALFAHSRCCRGAAVVIISAMNHKQRSSSESSWCAGPVYKIICK